ncbi:MAG: FKBP-type peptidyl-prolyl cis-trans isomerase, partial [Moraxellaceae bacterium]|nr:FKBP-type peptidyl-prolyl cis-trans isomerase [Moraxellaceae bacterium]
GFMTGKSSATQAPELDIEQFISGFRDGHANKEGRLTEEQMREAVMAFEQKLRTDMQAKQEKAALEASSKGTAFLAENGKKAGVITTASGLQYEVLKEGSGAKPKAESVVTVHYEGKLTDGTIFDSSVQRGEPVSFPLNKVIPGWTEGVQLMSPGAKYRFVIPSALAYGEQGAGPIPPHSVLVFEVELIEVAK